MTRLWCFERRHARPVRVILLDRQVAVVMESLLARQSKLPVDHPDLEHLVAQQDLGIARGTCVCSDFALRQGFQRHHDVIGLRKFFAT